MRERCLVVYGASGHAKVVIDAALRGGWSVVGLIDDDSTKKGTRIAGVPVLGAGLTEAVALARATSASAVVAIGSNRARKGLFEGLIEAGVDLATIVHPQAVVATSAALGRGTVVFAGVVINADTQVGDNVIVNTAASLDHDNQIGDHAHISPGVRLGGTVQVGAGTHVGIGATVRNNVQIGSWSLVGAGAVVVKDIPDRVVAFGNPARVIRENRE